MTILVIVQTTDPHRQAEALRAALGLTLRGAKVDVIHHGPLRTELARRALATLQAFGHAPATDLASALPRADAVEVWT